MALRAATVVGVPEGDLLLVLRMLLVRGIRVTEGGFERMANGEG